MKISIRESKRLQQVMAILAGLACGIFFWTAATDDDWLAGVTAGIFLCAFILHLGALWRDR